jgi:inner membrane protein
VATIAHLAVGLAAARRFVRSERESAHAFAPWAALFVALSFLPDVDKLALLLRVKPTSVLYPRGFTHSLCFAVVIGLIVGIVARWRGGKALRTGLLGGAVVASHGLLDMLTCCSYGVAYFWPISNARFFEDRGPLAVEPLIRRFTTARGFWLLVLETLLVVPLLVYAARRRPDAEPGNAVLQVDQPADLPGDDAPEVSDSGISTSHIRAEAHEAAPERQP